MVTFNVVKEQFGWSIQTGKHMTAPYRSRDMAIREAKRLADAICCYGEITEVTIEGSEPNEPMERIKGMSPSLMQGVFLGRWSGQQ